MFRNLFGDLFNALFHTLVLFGLPQRVRLIKFIDFRISVPFLAMGCGNNPIWMDENTATVVNQNLFLLISAFFTYSAKSRRNNADRVAVCV